jgi:hypothetical protein
MTNEIPWKPTHFHVKSGGIYQLLAVASDEVNPEKKKAVYRSSPSNPKIENRNRLWVRDYEEFIDGRFQQISGIPAELEFSMDKTNKRQTLFVASTLAIASIVSGNSNIPLISHVAMLQDLKAFGQTAVFPLEILDGYTGLSDITAESVIVIMLEDANDEVFAEHRTTLRRIVNRTRTKSGEIFNTDAA